MEYKVKVKKLRKNKSQLTGNKKRINLIGNWTQLIFKPIL